MGGAGYIGSHTAYELIDNGVDVVIADNLETGHMEAVHPKARFYQGDIRDRPSVTCSLRKSPSRGVIHFAANSLVGESMTKPLKYYDNNLCGTKVLLESMVAHGIDKIVFSSTAATYGEPENIPILETDPTHPTNTYGETKLSMERMFHWVGQAHGLRYVSLRYFNACGAHKSGQIGEAHHPETHLIPLILQVPLGQREQVSIYGDDYDTRDGTCVRDYIHVTDLAQAHILAMEYLQTAARAPSSTWQRGGLHRERGHRDRPQGDRPSHPRPDHPPPGRGSRPAGGKQREGQDRPGLEAPVRRPGDHYPERLEVAREPPQRLRQISGGKRAPMEKIASFTVNHLDLLPGVYVSRKDYVAKRSSPPLTCGCAPPTGSR